MTLEELKKTIESKQVPKDLLILKCIESFYIPNQYISYIRANTNFSIEFKSNYNELIKSNDIFAFESNANNLNVLKVDMFDCEDERLKSSNQTFIICNKVSKKSQELFSNYIIEIPKLEKWQIEDYVLSLAEGINEDKLKELLKLCNYDIYRLSSELDKITIFSEEQRGSLYDDFVDDGIFSDLSSYTVFDFTNSVIKRDYQNLYRVYKELSNIDVEPIGFLIILINNFKDIIDVQLSVNSSAETLNMKPNKYWAVKYSAGHYSKEELMNIYKFLTDLDKKIKLGEMPMQYLVDYIITKVMSCTF